MKLKVRTFIVVVCLCCSLSVTPVFAEWFMTTAVRYDTAYDNQSPETIGYEMTVPIGLAYRGKRLAVSLETAYSTANVETGPDTEAKLSGLTDTLVSASYAHLFPQRPIALIMGLDMNLPSGKERLNEEQMQAEWGQSNDLFEVDNFGEGFNIGLSLGLTRQFETVTLAAQGGYIYNGPFDPTSTIPDDDLDPGNQLLALGVLDWQAASWLRLNTFLSYTYFGTDQSDDTDSLRQGPQLAVGGNLSLDYRPWALSLALQGRFQGKNKVLVEDVLREETANSNGSGLFGVAALSYQLAENFRIRLLNDVRYYAETELTDKATSLPYTGRRIRYAGGPGFTYAVTSRLSCNGLLKFFVMEQQQDAFTPQDLTFRGLNLNLELTYEF